MCDLHSDPDWHIGIVLLPVKSTSTIICDTEIKINVAPLVCAYDGTVMQIVTEQKEIRVDDCVIVEESGGRANIRRTLSRLSISTHSS
jgi:hypothetical protein